MYIFMTENLKNMENHKEKHLAYNVMPRNNHLTLLLPFFPLLFLHILKINCFQIVLKHAFIIYQ